MKERDMIEIVGLTGLLNAKLSLQLREATEKRILQILSRYI